MMNVGGPVWDGGINSFAATIDQVVADLDGVLGQEGTAGLDHTDRLELLRAAGAALRRIHAVVVETVATAEPAFPDRCGCCSTNEVLQRMLGLDAPGAARVTRAAAAVRRETSLSSGERLPARYPAVRQALLDGVLTVEGMLAATGPIEQAGDRISAAERAAADAALADYARGSLVLGAADVAGAGDPDAGGTGPDAHGAGANSPDAGGFATGPAATPDDLRRFAQLLAMTLDPDGAEPDDLRAQQQRFVTLGRLRDGVHPLRGNLLPDAAAQLQLIIDAQCSPRTAGPAYPGVVFSSSDEGQGDAWNSDPRNVVDQRTAAQKRHDALAAALGIAARHDDMPTLAGAAPTLVVHVDAEDLASGVGRATVGGSEEPVPLRVAAQAACAGAIQRVLFDRGRIVGIDVVDRVFPVHLRRAIVARDRECLIPGCHVPASWCEIHHVVEHAAGGPTATDNGVPLCWWHHRSLDRSGWEIRMAHGCPQIRGPGWWDPERRWRSPRPQPQYRSDRWRPRHRPTSRPEPPRNPVAAGAREQPALSGR